MARRLKAQPGTDEANYGGSRFRVDNDGFVEVPDEAAPSLIDRGGFVDAADAPVNMGEAATSPVCRMLAPENAGPVSWAGQVYEIAEGLVLVPPAASVDLAAHGFVLIKD